MGLLMVAAKSAVPDDARIGADGFLALGGLFAAVLGAKLLVIAAYGGISPYWDQWDAEAALLYKPYVDGTLDWGTLFVPHNEHRILFTRLLGLALLEFAGEWDPLLEMVVNAVLHAGFLTLMTALAGRVLAPPERLPLAIFVALVFAVPIGWENTLAGFQSQFYLVLLFTISSIYVFIDCRALSPRWWIGFLLALAAYFSLASGFFTIVAIIVMVAAQMLLGTRARSLREWAGLAILGVLALIAFLGVPQLPWHEPLKAHSLGAFLSAMFRIASMPLPMVGLILHIPLLWFALRMLRAPRQMTRAHWTVLALAAWVGLQMVSLSYGRSSGVLSSRYLDLVIILLPLDYIALRWLTGNAQRSDATGVLVPAAWMGLLAIGLAWFALSITVPQVVDRGRQGANQQDNVAAFLASGDISTISDKPFLDVPYPDAGRLASLLSDPTIRMVLPADLRPADTGAAVLHERLVFEGALSEIARKARRISLTHPAWSVVLGLILFFASAFAGAARFRRAHT